MDSYSGLAAFMANHPDIAIFRTFSKLNTKNLLYYQAEIALLEEELNRIEIEDRKAGGDRELFHTRFRSLANDQREREREKEKERQAQGQVGLSNLPAPPDPRESLQWDIFTKLRAVLEPYNAALLQKAQLDALSSPKKGNLRVLREWLETERFGNNFLAGTDNPERVWGTSDDAEKGHSDLVATRDIGGISYQFARFYTALIRLCGPDRRGTNHEYDADGTPDGKLARTIAAVVATLIPVAPIFALAFIDPLWIRLLAILGFTTATSLLLVLGVKLKADQALAITLASAAIQVVFVGSTTRWSDLRKS